MFPEGDEQALENGVLGDEKGRQHLGLERIKTVAKQLRSAVIKAVGTGEDSVLSFSG